MRVFVLRHGDAVVPPGGKARSLTLRGEREAQAAGRLLAGRGIDCVFSSPLLRARQTTALVQPALGDISVTFSDDLVPPSTGETLCAQIEACGAETVLLVSHMPLVAHLVSWLVAGDYRSYPLVGYPEAGTVALDMDICGQGMATLAWFAFPPDFDKRRQ
ncbi:MAG: histidine phosphatase family protein [Pseudomonadota bacterium]